MADAGERSLPQRRNEKLQDLQKGKVLSVSRLMGEAIHRIHNDESVSSLFHMDIDR